MCKIIHVLNSLDPRSGGPVTVVRGIVREQLERGYQLIVVATNAQATKPWLPEREYISQVLKSEPFVRCKIYLLKSFGGFRPMNRFNYTPSAASTMLQLIEAESPQLIHVHGVFGHLGVTCCMVAKRMGVPYIVEPYGQLDEHCMKSGFAIFKKLMYRFLVRPVLEHAACIQVASPFEKQEATKHRLRAPIRIIPHGIDFSAGRMAVECETILDRYHDLRKRRFILYLSRLHKIKRPHWVLDSFLKVRDKHPDLALVFAGPDAGMESYLRSKVEAAGLEHEVVFTGFLQGPNKVAFFDSASVFCLPSKHENFGVAVVEAMAHGSPVVVTPGVASHIYVDEAGCGFTVEDSVDAVAEGIRKVLLSDRTELGRRGREYVEKYLTWQAVVENIDEVYQDILRKRSRARYLR